MENKTEERGKFILEFPVPEYVDNKVYIDINTEIFAKFFGLWLMKLPIPEDMYEYIRDHTCPVKDFDVPARMIFGAPDPQFTGLRQMIGQFLK